MRGALGLFLCLIFWWALVHSFADDLSIVRSDIVLNDVSEDLNERKDGLEGAESIDAKDIQRGDEVVEVHRFLQGIASNPVNASRPARRRASRPRLGRASRPVNASRPARARPVRGRSSRPVRGRSSRPVRGRSSRPVRGRASRPVRSRASRPVNASRPARARPVRGRSSRPVRGRSSRPVRGRASSPARARGQGSIWSPKTSTRVKRGPKTSSKRTPKRAPKRGTPSRVAKRRPKRTPNGGLRGSRRPNRKSSRAPTPPVFVPCNSNCPPPPMLAPQCGFFQTCGNGCFCGTPPAGPSPAPTAVPTTNMFTVVSPPTLPPGPPGSGSRGTGKQASTRKPSRVATRRATAAPSAAPSSATPTAAPTLDIPTFSPTETGLSSSSLSSSSSSSGGMGTAGVVGVAVGCVVIFALIGFFFCCASRGKNDKAGLIEAMRASSFGGRHSFEHHDVYSNSAPRDFSPYVAPEGRPSSHRASLSAAPGYPPVGRGSMIGAGAQRSSITGDPRRSSIGIRPPMHNL